MGVITAIPRNLVAPHQVILKQAHATNYSAADAPVHGGYRRRAKASALVIHTPEEPADAVEVTPFYFARDLSAENRRASTDAYADSDGDLWLMVSDEDSPFANGVLEARKVWEGSPTLRPPWYESGVSYNSVTRSIEVEGYAATIGETLTPEQYECVVRWAAFWCGRDGIPADRDHIVGHQEIDSGKRDPGTFPLDRLAADVKKRLAGAGPVPPVDDEFAIRVYVALLGEGETSWASGRVEQGEPYDLGNGWKEDRWTIVRRRKVA